MRKSYLYAIAATLLWSTVATAFKFGLHHFNHDTAALLGWSVLMAVLFLGVLSIIQAGKNSIRPMNIRSIRNSAILGALNPFLYYLVLFKAYDLLPASEAQPLNYTWPITLSVFSAVVFKQKMRWHQMVSVGLGFAGVWILSTRGLFHVRLSNPTGVFLAVGSSVIWAVYWIGNMRDGRQALPKITLNFIFGVIYLFLYLFIQGNISIPSYYGMICAIWIGLGEMGLTFVLWMRALESAPSAGSVSHVVYLSPFISLLFLHTLVGEDILSSSIAGLCLIIGGVIFGSVKSSNVTKN